MSEDIEKLYLAIDELFSKILAAIAAEKFEESSEYLDIRLVLLKQLSLAIQEFDVESEEYKYYISFIEKTQQKDESQQENLLLLRQDFLKKNISLKQSSVAINAYQSNSQKS